MVTKVAPLVALNQYWVTAVPRVWAGAGERLPHWLGRQFGEGGGLPLLHAPLAAHTPPSPAEQPARRQRQVQRQARLTEAVGVRVRHGDGQGAGGAVHAARGPRQNLGSILRAWCGVVRCHHRQGKS